MNLNRLYLPEMSPIETGTGTDYLYRATAPKAAVSRAIGDAIADIDYPNFKDAVGYDNLDRSRVLIATEI